MMVRSSLEKIYDKNYIFEVVFDYGEDIFKKLSIINFTSLKKFLMIAKTSLKTVIIIMCPRYQ